jgi:hypothetical protein
MQGQMDWAATALDLILGVGAGTWLGFWLGKRAKLRELHQLQEEGYLSITYVGQEDHRAIGPESLPHPGGGSSDGPTIHELLHTEEPGQPIGDELGRVRYARRDGEERRDDWAKALKARQQRAALPEPKPDKPEP